MFRRPRFSVKPNVRPNAAGRSSNSGGSTGAVSLGGAASDGDGQHGSAPITSSPATKGNSILQTGAPAAVTDSGDFHLSEDSNNSKRNEKTSDTSRDVNSKKHVEIFPQRRKRISTTPNLIKPRITPPSTHQPAGLGSKCSQKQAPHSPKQVPHTSTIGNSILQKESSSSENISVENSPKSPVLPEKKTPVPQVPQFSPFKKSASKETSVSQCISDEALQKSTCSPLKERPTQERLMQEETTQSKSVSANEKRVCSDCEKIIKTQKLRKMLKEELKKEKKQQKFTYPVTEKHMPEDRSKMIMRDFIYYLPENNPMKSSLIEEKKIEKTSTVTQAKEPEERIVAGHEDENEEDEEGEGEDDGSLLVPRVKVAEDGSIILDEESLTVEVLRTKGQCVVEENDPIFERGSTTTYSSFRKSYYARPWSEKETDMFFFAISMVGTDFSMISQLFPHRARTEIKNKFKREEKVNGWRIDKAFKEKKPFDFNLFTKLLEKVLENERKKKDKDARCERQKEKNTNKRNTSKSQKKRKDKIVNRQSSHSQDEHPNANTSDVELEVDAETAEKENEESPSILEQAEGQTAIESTMTKKRRKRRKKDSDQEAENHLEERTVPAEMIQGERTRKKRKITSTDEVVEELEVPSRIIPDEALITDEEVPPNCIKLNEEAERDQSIQGRMSGCVELSSVSQMPSNQNTGDSGETNETENEVAEIDKLGKSQNMSSQNDEEIMETDAAVAEKLTIQRQPQMIASGLSGTSEKRKPPMRDRLVVEVCSESLVENKAKQTQNASSNFIRVTEETQKAFAETVEVRGRRQRLNPDIVKVSDKKTEAPAQVKCSSQEPKDTTEKEEDQNDAALITTAEITETDCQGLDRESVVNKQYTSQENNKQTVLKPAPLARGRFQRPKPNLGRVARRQEELGRKTKAEEKASKTPTETEKIVMQTDCNDDQLPNKDVTEATTTTTVASIEKVNSACSNQSPVPLECESHNLRHTTLPLDSIKNVADLVSRDSSLQKEQKENFVETEHSSESSPPSLKENLENASERKQLLHTGKHKSETVEESSVNLTDEYDETSNQNNLSAVKSDTTNEVSLIPDSHKKESEGKQSSQEIKQSDIQSTRLVRGRFQRPKPNIGRVIGRKGRKSLEGNEETTVKNLGLQKSEFTKSSSVVTQLKCDDKVLPGEASESRLLNSEEIIQEDSQPLGTLQKSSDQCSRENFVFQEDKLYTVKPVRLARGRFQRTRLNLERLSCKKEEPVSRNVGAPMGEVKEKEVIEKDDLFSTLEDGASVQASLDNLGRKEGSDTIEILSKSCTSQKKHPSSEKLLADGLLKNQEPVCVSKDNINRKNLDITGSDIFAPQEINQTERMVDHRLQKLQSNVAQVTKNKGKNGTEEQTGKDVYHNATSDGNKSRKMVELLGSLGHLRESASSSELWRGKKYIESSESIFPPRSRHSRKHDPSDQSSESQIRKEIPKSLSVQEREAELLKGKQPRTTLKQRKKNSNSKTSFNSECENDPCRKVKHHQKVKPHISRGRSIKSALHKKSRKEYGHLKVNLVTLRASSQEDEEDEDEDEDEPESDYEVESFSPEEVNKAPVFVPKGLRSPNPVPVQTEETMEELEIYENVAEEPCLSHDLNPSNQPMIQEDKELHFSPLDITQEDQKKNTGINYGSTEAAMTLLAMRDPVFQLRTDTQEKMQEFLNKDEPSCAASFPDEGNEVQTVVSSKNELFSSNNISNTAIEGKRTEPSGFKDCLEEKTIVLLSDSSYNVLVTSHDANKTTTEYHSLEECSQETTRACSKVSLCKSNKTSRPARYRLLKPKPNLNSGLALRRNTSQNSLGLSSGLEESKEIQNEVRMSQKYVEEQNVELNLQADEQLTRISTAGTHDLHSENVGPAVQKNNMESGNPIEEIWGIASELIAPKLSQEAITCPPEVSDNLNLKSNVQAPRPVEHHFSVADTAQTERNKNPNISVMAEMSTVSGGFKDLLDAEEEPKFILTLVEISADAVDCSGSLPQGSEELLPAPVLSTSNNMHLLELTKDESVGSITASAEENAASIKDTTERGLEVEQVTNLGLTSWTNLKSSSVTLEESGASEEKIPTLPVDEHLKSSDKDTSLKLRCIPRKSAEKSSEKRSSSKKEITPSSEPIPQTTDQPAEEREQPQSSLNIGVFLLNEAAGTAGQTSRTPSARKIEISEEQRLFVDIYSCIQSDQAGNTEDLSKTPLSRSYQRSLGFLPLICNMNADGEVAAKGNKSLQKTCTLFSEDIVECPASSSKDNNGKIQDYSSLPSATLSPSKYESGSCSAVQDEGSSKEQEKEEEPTRISEYFFSDIFMEVDDSE